MTAGEAERCGVVMGKGGSVDVVDINDIRAGEARCLPGMSVDRRLCIRRLRWNGYVVIYM